MTHAAINLHHQTGDLDPSDRLHGMINLHGDRTGIRMHVNGYRTSWGASITAADAINLARALTAGETVATANLGMGRAIVNKGFRNGVAILTMNSEAVAMHTEMSTSDLQDLARTLSALVELDH